MKSNIHKAELAVKAKRWRFDPDRAVALIMTDCPQRFTLERLINIYVFIAWCLSAGSLNVDRFVAALALHLTLTKTKNTKKLASGEDPTFVPLRFSFQFIPDRMKMLWYREFEGSFLSAIPDLSSATDRPSLGSYNLLIENRLNDIRGALAIAQYIEKAVGYNPNLVATRRKIQDAMVGGVLDLPKNYFRSAGPSRREVDSALAPKTFDKLWDSSPKTLLLTHFVKQAIVKAGLMNEHGKTTLLNNRTALVAFQERDGEYVEYLRSACAAYRDVSQRCVASTPNVRKFEDWHCVEVDKSRPAQLAQFSEEELGRLQLLSLGAKRAST